MSKNHKVSYEQKLDRKEKELRAYSRITLVDEDGNILEDSGWKEHEVFRNGVNSITNVTIENAFVAAVGGESDTE